MVALSSKHLSMYWQIIGLVMLWFICILGANAQQPSDSIEQAPKGSWVVLPVVYYAPETRFGFGALAMHSRRLSDDTLTRSSNIQMYGLYTLNNQILISPRYTLIFDRERYILNGNLAYFKFPQLYYGIGNNLPEENEELIDYTLLRAENRFLKQWKPHFFAGPVLNLYKVYKVETEAGGWLEQNKPNGYTGYYSGGAGLSLVYDTRDVVVNAYKGSYLEVTSVFYGKALGSDFGYQQYIFDFRGYKKLNKLKHVLATQFVAQLSSGDVPFLELPDLGGDRLMRGYYQGRYRDKQYVTWQAEYRAPLFWRLGAVAFAGVGRVAPVVSDLSFDGLKPSYGLGARFMVDKAERINIRFDYGFGKETSGFYLEITEAF